MYSSPGAQVAGSLIRGMLTFTDTLEMGPSFKVSDSKGKHYTERILNSKYASIMHPTLMPHVLLFDFLGLYTSLHPFFNAKTPRESHPLSLWQYNVVELVPWGLRKRDLGST